MRRISAIIVSGFALVLIIGTARNRDFWSTPDQRGEKLFRAGKFADAAKSFSDPWRIGIAQYRNGDFEAAAKTFARVPGAVGALDQGNAWLMHGNYDQAIASYDRALGFKPGWSDAQENKSVAVARRARIEASGKDKGEEQTDTGKPDEIRFDQKGQKGKPVELASQSQSDEQIRATWLRQVQTTPSDFLRAKFAYQAANQPGSQNEGGGKKE